MSDGTVSRRPLLKTWYRTAREDDRLLLEYGDSLTVFEGRAATLLMPVLLPLLDGTRTVDDIVELTGPGTREAVENAVRVLDQHGLLTEGCTEEDLHPAVTDTIDFLAATEVRSPAEIGSALASAAVAVAGSSWAAAEVARLLRISGVSSVERVHLSEPAIDAGMVIVVPSAAEVLELGTWNRRAIESGQVWMQLLPYNGRFVAVGPVYVPGETACYDCFLYRRLSLIGYDEA